MFSQFAKTGPDQWWPHPPVLSRSDQGQSDYSSSSRRRWRRHLSRYVPFLCFYIFATCLSLCLRSLYLFFMIFGWLIPFFFWSSSSSSSSRFWLWCFIDGVRRLRREVVLLTDDRNLRVKALSRDVPVRDLPAFLAWSSSAAAAAN